MVLPPFSLDNEEPILFLKEQIYLRNKVISTIKFLLVLHLNEESPKPYLSFVREGYE